jgi:hypothetical protein
VVAVLAGGGVIVVGGGGGGGGGITVGVGVGPVVAGAGVPGIEPGSPPTTGGIVGVRVGSGESTAPASWSPVRSSLLVRAAPEEQCARRSGSTKKPASPDHEKAFTETARRIVLLRSGRFCPESASNVRHRKPPASEGAIFR